MFIKSLSNNVCLCQNAKKELFIAKYASNDSLDLLKEIFITNLLSTGYCVLSKSKSINDLNYKNIHNDDHEIDKTCCDIFTRIGVNFCCKYDSHEKNFVMNSNNEALSICANGDAIYKIINKNHDISLYGTVINIEQSVNKYYMILNHAGLDLYEYVTKHRYLSEDICKIIFRQLIRAIKSMHDLGFVHGDISLENICITIEDNAKKSEQVKIKSLIKIKLIDFGLSLIHPMSAYYGIMSRTKNITNRDNALFKYDRAYIINGLDDICVMTTKLKPGLINYGKKQYISPERYDAHLNEHNFYCSYADDIYSLGIVLFCMLLGRIPYESPDESDPMFREIMSGSWRYKVKNCSNDVIDLIDMLLKREDKRISLDNIMNHGWLMCF